MRPIRVLHVAPMWFPVGRNAPGGIESYLPSLLAALARAGADNTVIASGDSDVPARLIPAVERNVWDLIADGAAWEYAAFEQHQLRLAVEHARDADIVHSHIGPAGFFLSGLAEVTVPILHTYHNEVSPELAWFLRRHPDLCLSAVSEFQAGALRRAGAVECTVIHNAVDVASFRLGIAPERRLVFLGRMEKEKGPDLAIRVARKAGLPLTLAGPVVDADFFDAAVAPALNHQVSYAGVLDHTSKDELLSRAACLLVPSRTEEAFGMVSIEAMACGTPVVALARGGIPEVVEAGVTGFTGEQVGDLASLVHQALKLDRAVIRARATARFDLADAAGRYVDLYRRILAGHPMGATPAGPRVVR